MKSLLEQRVTATKAWFENGWIYIHLEDDLEIRFPVEKNRRLRSAPTSALQKIELICGGAGLHWPDLDEDLSVQGILEGRFGPAG